MKKIFLLAMMAVAFMACENNNGGGGGSGASGLSSSDLKAVKATTEQATDLIGKTPAQVDKSLVAAGYVKLDESDLASVIRRIRAKAPKATSDQWEVQYVYNLPKNYQKMSEEEGVKWVNDQLKADKSIIMIMAVYYEQQLISLYTGFTKGKTEKVNLVYTDISEGLYKTILKKATYQEWQGEIDQKDYEDHSAFLAAIGVGESIEAEEEGIAAEYNMATDEVSGRGYYAYWMNPNEKQEATQLENGFIMPIVTGTFTVWDYAQQGINLY